MKKSVLKKIKSPLITFFLNTPNFYKTDIEVLALCASGQLDQATESQRKSTLFQSIASNSKMNDSVYAQVLLSYLIEQGHTVYPFEAALRELSKVISTLDINLLFETMGLDVLKRLSLMEPIIAQVVFTHVCSKLQASTLAWLHAQLTIRHPLNDRNHDLSELEAPALNHPDTPYAQAALHIIIHQNQLTELPEILYQCYTNQTTEPERNLLDKLIKIYQCESIQRSYSEWSDSIVNFKPGFYDEALAKVKKLKLNELRIYYSLLVVNELVPQPTVEERHLTEIMKLVSEFNVPAVFQAIKDTLTSLDPDCIETTHQLLKDAINHLSSEARAWLFCSLYLGRSENIDRIGKPWSPLDDEKETCESLLTLATSQPSIRSFINEHLDLTTPVGDKLTAHILSVLYFQNIASLIEKHLGQDGRLWFTLMLETNQASALFQIQNHSNEYYDNTSIRNPMDQIDTVYFLKLANSSPKLRDIILKVFKNNSDSQSFKTKMHTLSYYIQHHVDSSIHSLSPNDKAWLYLAVLLQMRLQSPLNGAGFQLVPPSGESHKKIQILLQELYLNPKIKGVYLERLYRSLDSQQQAFINNLTMNYVKQIVSKSDDNECQWILLSMLSQPEPSHEIYPGKTIAYSPDRALPLARLLSIANYKPEIWSTLQNLLKERLPSIEEKIYSTHYGLSEGLQQLSTGNQLASDYLSSAELAEKGLLLLIPELHKTDISWLKTTINSAMIDYRAHREIAFQQDYQESNRTSSNLLAVILLIVKYPAIRKKCAELLECNTTRFPEYSSIILDGLELEDQGFRALSDAIITQKLRLRVLSLCDTNLTNPDFESFSPIIENKGIVKFQIIDNNLSDKSLRELTRIGDIHPDTQNTLISTLLQIIHDPFSWAALQIGVQSKCTPKDFYFSEPGDYPLINKLQIWLKNNKLAKTKSALTSQELPQYFKDFQLCHAALSRKETVISQQLFFILFKNLESAYQIQVHELCSNSLRLESSLMLSKQHLANQQEAFYNYCLVFCLFIHLRRYTPDWLETFFRLQNINENLDTLHIQTNRLTPELYALLKHTVLICPEVGKTLEVTGEWEQEEADLLIDLCSHLQNLILSESTLTETSIRNISPLIQRNTLLKLHLKNTTFQEQGLHALFERLQESSILSLSLSNSNEDNAPFSFTHLFEISRFLKDPFCPLQLLKLEGYKLPNNAYKTLFTALKSNKDSNLRELSLNGSCTEDAQAEALAQLAALPSLEVLVCNDHCCTAKQLREIYQAVRDNLNLHIVELRQSDAHLKSLSGIEQDECTQIIQDIESLIIERRANQITLEDSKNITNQNKAIAITNQYKLFKGSSKTQEVPNEKQGEQVPHTLNP